MKRILIAAAFILLLSGQSFAGIEDFLTSLNIQAKADLGAFSAKIGAQFGAPAQEVREVVSRVEAPADAFMVYQLGQWTHNPPETVMPVYQKNKGQGWGAIAKSLGIKPGSAEFHALKRGDLALTGAPTVGNSGEKPGKGRGKGRGHNK